MNSKAAQLTENGTEIVRLFARFALGASFLSAAADRFGLCFRHGSSSSMESAPGRLASLVNPNRIVLRGNAVDHHL